MSTDLSFYRQVARALIQGPVVIATVIQTSGSVPREVGAKLLVCSDGRVFGSIGGGAGEAKVLQQAQVVLASGDKQSVAIDLSGAPQREIQGICGGQMQVWLERWQGDIAHALTHRIVQQLTQGQSLALITPLSQAHFSSIEENVSGIGEAREVTLSLQLGRVPPTFRALLQPPPTLLIVGAGHCGIQLARVAKSIGFQVLVQDDRPNWANPTNFPQANQLFHQPIATVVDELADYSQLYAALVTRGIDYDLPALNALLRRSTPCRYIGMIGSQKRVHRALQALPTENMSQARAQSLYAPIGLDIGALTPEEIAVSICAELIMVRRGGTGRSLSAFTSQGQENT